MIRWEPAVAFFKPAPQRCDERFGFQLPDSAALISLLAADLGFDLIEFGDPLQASVAIGAGGDLAISNHCRLQCAQQNASITGPPSRFGSASLA